MAAIQPAAQTPSSWVGALDVRDVVGVALDRHARPRHGSRSCSGSRVVDAEALGLEVGGQVGVVTWSNSGVSPSYISAWWSAPAATGTPPYWPEGMMLSAVSGVVLGGRGAAPGATARRPHDRPSDTTPHPAPLSHAPGAIAASRMHNIFRRGVAAERGRLSRPRRAKLAADARHLCHLLVSSSPRPLDRPGDAARLRPPPLVAARARGRARGALRVGLVDGAAAGRGHHGVVACAWPRRSPPPISSAGSTASPRRASPGGAGCARRAGARVAAVHRRGPLRHPRHRAQPRHVAAPVRRRPARRRRHRAADLRRLPARPARDRRRALGARPEHGAGLRRARDRDRGRRLPGRARAARPARRPAARSPARWSSASPTWSPPTWSRARSRRRSRRCSCSRSRSAWASSRAVARERRGAARCARCRSRCSRSAASTPTASRGCCGSAGRSRSGRRSSSLRARRAAALPRRRLRSARRRRRRSRRSACSRSRSRPSSAGSPTSPSFETFDPAGAGLGNLFDRLSPLEALGIWPSGDFRVEPGDGAVPAIVFYLGAAVGAAALAFGLRWSLARARARGARGARRGDAAVALRAGRRHALPGGEGAGDGRAPVVAIVSVRALLASGATVLLAAAFLVAAGRLERARRSPTARSGRAATRRSSPSCASGCRGLDRGAWSPAELLDEQHGPTTSPGSCAATGSASRRRSRGARARAGGRRPVTIGLDGDGAVVADAVETAPRVPGPGPCPLIPDAARADPSAGG